MARRGQGRVQRDAGVLQHPRTGRLVGLSCPRLSCYLRHKLMDARLVVGLITLKMRWGKRIINYRLLQIAAEIRVNSGIKVVVGVYNSLNC